MSFALILVQFDKFDVKADDQETSSMDFNEFLLSLVRSVIEGVRRNKLPACLSAIAIVLTTGLVLTSDFDERPRYRKLILPDIEKAENRFFDVMREAEQETTEPRKALCFIEGHYRAKSVLRIANAQWPTTAKGKKAQRDLIRYYELLDDEFAIIRSEMSFVEGYDYMSDWKQRNAELLPIRERWVKWVQP